MVQEEDEEDDHSENDQRDTKKEMTHDEAAKTARDYVIILVHRVQKMLDPAKASGSDNRIWDSLCFNVHQHISIRV